MNNDKSFHIDYQAIAQQIADKAIAEIISVMMPDEQSRKLMLGLMDIHRKHGVDTATSIKIIEDTVKLLKEVV